MSNRALPVDIVLVEDSDDDAFFFFRALEKVRVSCACKRVRDGEEFISFLKAHRNQPFLVFLDLKMPHLNGLEALRWIQEWSFKNYLSIFVLSGSDVPGDIRQARRLGAIDYICKPISVHDLSRIIADYLGKQNE